jgi:hypothetical protein
MALLKLPQKRNDGVEYIDHRSLYYNKYRYRARLYCTGIYLAMWNLSLDDIEKKVKSNKHRLKDASAYKIKNFIDWKNTQPKGNNKINTVRIEGNVASIFSNDLNSFKSLENLGCPIDYTEIGDNIPIGTKYFVKEPKYKYRFYLKSKRVHEDFRTRLALLFDRYKDTETKIFASPSLKQWLEIDTSFNSWSFWKHNYCSSHFFIDYNDESFITLFALSFDQNMISAKYKLEKRPEQI